MWQQWMELVEKNKNKEDTIAWAYPISNGLYLPSPLSSIDMAFSVETDSLLKVFPGEEWALFPEDPFTYLVHGTDDYAIGWLQYMCFRFPNVMGWTSYIEPLTGYPFLDLTRVIRLLDNDSESQLKQIKESNPLGVNVVIQSQVESPLDLSIPSLRLNGDFIFITTYPVDETILKELFLNFHRIYLLRPYWTTPPSSPLVVVAGIQYIGPQTTPDKELIKEYQQSEKDVLKSMVDQQVYLSSLTMDPYKTSPTLFDFFIKSFPSWDI